MITLTFGDDKAKGHNHCEHIGQHSRKPDAVYLEKNWQQQYHGNFKYQTAQKSNQRRGYTIAQGGEERGTVNGKAGEQINKGG